jgi:hypothetical protein
LPESIGIKTAQGAFYPLIDAYSDGRKEAILSTIRDNQPSMQIDFYKSYARSMVDALYLGSLVIDNIPEAKSHGPSLVLELESNENGDFSAQCNGHVLETSVKASESQKDALKPEVVSGYPPPELYGRQKKIRSNFPWPAIIVAGVIIAVLCVGLFFFLNWAQKRVAPNSTTTTSQSAKAPQPEPASPAIQVQPVPKVPSPAVSESQPQPAQQLLPGTVAPLIQRFSRRRTHRNAPVYSYKKPSMIPSKGLRYKVRWGDTLWDIANAFYHNGFAYTRIAWYNNISDAATLIAGTTIVIPPL